MVAGSAIGKVQPSWIEKANGNEKIHWLENPLFSAVILIFMVWNTEIHSEFKGVVIALTSNFSIVFLNYLIQRIQTETMHFAVRFGGFGEIPLNLDSLLNRVGYFDKDKTAVANTA